MAAGQLVPLGTKSKQLSNKEHTMAVAMLIGRLQNECLAYGLTPITTKKFCIQQR